MKKYKVLIGGMSCGHCENHIRGSLASIHGVSEVTASAKDKSAMISSENTLDERAVKEAVESAGYIYKGMIGE